MKIRPLASQVERKLNLSVFDLESMAKGAVENGTTEDWNLVVNRVKQVLDRMDGPAAVRCYVELTHAAGNSPGKYALLSAVDAASGIERA